VACFINPIEPAPPRGFGGTMPALKEAEYRKKHCPLQMVKQALPQAGGRRRADHETVPAGGPDGQR